MVESTQRKLDELESCSTNSLMFKLLQMRRQLLTNIIFNLKCMLLVLRKPFIRFRRCFGYRSSTRKHIKHVSLKKQIARKCDITKFVSNTCILLSSSSVALTPKVESKMLMCRCWQLLYIPTEHTLTVIFRKTRHQTDFCVRSSRKHGYIMLTPLNPTFI